MPPTHSLRASLRLLLQAHEYAVETGRSAWDFAVEIGSLRSIGLTNSELRWLLYENFLDHAAETTVASAESRSFAPLGKVALTEQSCFVLTLTGIGLARVGWADSLPCGCRTQPAVEPTAAVPAVQRPFWDKDRRALLFAGELVKQFKVPAPNQELILAVLQEEHWPARIDDPLPLHASIEPKRRLHDTINSLNRNQRAHRLRFLGDGSGQAVLWEPTAGGAAEAPAGKPLVADRVGG
jgi:hypothetical protein